MTDLSQRGWGPPSTHPTLPAGSGSSPHAWRPRRRRAPGTVHRLSIPQTWGPLPSLQDYRRERRPIPTSVENAACRPLGLSPRSVHPHKRGDHLYTTPDMMLPDDPSPQAWGLLGLTGPTDGRRRLIPTGVGTTDKPKMLRHRYDGSSPRTWGLRHVLDGTQRHVRLIPTSVGTTLLGAVLNPDGMTYPHGCGDYIIERNIKFPQLGSSPRAWGLPSKNRSTTH